jgi:hypothetical protein
MVRALTQNNDAGTSAPWRKTALRAEDRIGGDRTEEEVSKLVKKPKRKLKSILTTADSVAQFMAELEVALSLSASDSYRPPKGTRSGVAPCFI